MKNEKAAGASGLTLEMVKAAGEAGGNMITDLVNPIIMEGVIPAEWEFSTFPNCFLFIGIHWMQG